MTLNEGVNLIEGRSAFCLAVRCELALLATVETLPVTRELTWVDEDFSEWPLDGGQLQVHLEAFLRRPGRRLRMIAHRFGPIAQRHPRFAAWRKNWSHALDAWEFPEPGVLGSVLVM